MQLGKCDWRTVEQGQERCFLLTNGLGGYSSLTVLNSNNRNDHALLMGAITAPNYRFHYVTNVMETVEIDGVSYELSTQEYVNRTKNQLGFIYQQMMTYDLLPEWTYQVEGITIRKQLVMVNGENTIGIRYQLMNPCGKKAKLRVTPLLRFTEKDKQIKEGQPIKMDEHCIRSNGQCLFFYTNGRIKMQEQTEYIRDLYYEYDARDGRDCVGTAAKNHTILFDVNQKKQEFYLIYSDQDKERHIHEMFLEEENRQKNLMATAKLNNPVANRLVRSADQFISLRESTNGYTIIAGYPFFSDWGRDTMIAMLGCTITTKQFEKAKGILRTFETYCKDGVMPNLFPECQSEPLYNTVDASLLFVNAVYEYYQATNDLEFVREMYDCMKQIIACYKKGTINHIYMDEDGLIAAGDGLEQVTWMDVRINDYLPTPRHGKPVEINAYWYNALCIMDEFETKFGNKENSYQTLAQLVKKSFVEQFYMEEKGYLKDVLSNTKADEQIRCNQVWALSMPYCMLNEQQAERILAVLDQEIYTPYGLRSLSIHDEQFHAVCTGNQWSRDNAYHQGTVWAFPLGAYFLAKLRFMSPEREVDELDMIKHQLRMFETCMMEGCIGQVAEIYDGLLPNESRGCYAQAWSVGEMLRVYEQLEKVEAKRK